MEYRLSKKVMADKGMRSTFNELAVKTFHLSFENWYQEGYCSESYLPYTLFHGDKAIANVSVNRMEVLWKGQVRRYIQLGTVMTDTEYRNQGISRYLLEEVLKDWRGQCDAMFLFANKNVLDFYPKFGFEKEKQYRFCTPMDRPLEAGIKLHMDSARDRELLKTYYEKTNPFSRMQVIHNYGLLMFYCMSPLKDCVFYSRQHDAVVIAEQDGEHFVCYDVYCDGGRKLQDVLSSVAAAGTKTVNLGFAPMDREGFEPELVVDEEDTLFVLRGGENIFRNEKMLFPLISHT